MEKSYGGGLFEPLQLADFRALRRQFRPMVGQRFYYCRYSFAHTLIKGQQDALDPLSCDCAWQWSKSRHNVMTRKETAREKGLNSEFP